ncbi:MAG: LysM peptidoglycan-binding domain-containing protein [Saprospiraceae bacterium]|uniref:Peptidoglycan hydrolase n=1 Tax=Candidatus Opimibacter skivensis TaxID=2982028 RepID=A0A9D7XSE7_9BACT|nr:LysM peptidoglycan-binding domain-containing protein [Candidatus Opimibacter skivensis]
MANVLKKEDDDYEDGKLVKSCFREFSSVYDSHVAHSDFLTDPAKANRYGFLFDLKPTDYKAWAKGLSKAGYATDPKYADRLIDIIEKYDLAELDTETYDGGSIVGTKDLKSYRPVRYYNDIKYIIAGKADSPNSLAAQVDLRAKQIVKYNDDIRDEEQLLTPGSRVYLQPKRNQYKGHQKYHTLKADENLVSVSQQYGIKLSALQKRNGLASNETPMANQKILLKGKIKTALKLVDPYAVPVVKKNSDVAVTTSHPANVVKTTKPVTTPVAKPVTTPVASPVLQSKMDTVVITSPKPVELIPAHTVSKGDTLYGIARSYGMSVEELKKMNNLSVDTLSIGQKLVVR